MNLVKSSSFAPAGNKEYTRTNFGAKYTLANMMFGFSYETAKEKQTNDKHTGYGASFSADFDKVSVRLAAGSKTDKSTGNPDVKGTVVAVGVDYKLGKGAKVFAEVANLGKELANSGPAASPKSSSLVQIGAVLGF